MPKTNASQLSSYQEVSKELQGLVEKVKDKELSLESSLDLFEQAIEYATRAIDLVDSAQVDALEESEQDAETPDGGEENVAPAVGEPVAHAGQAAAPAEETANAASEEPTPN